MLATFCLRLACGLTGALLILSPAQVAPRFYRVQFLTVLGLIAVAAVSLAAEAGPALGMALGSGLVLAFLGSFVWSLEGAPAGRSVTGLTLLALVSALWLVPVSTDQQSLVARAWRLGNDLTSAALLGTATSAMLMGHSYLVAPAMSLTPLLRLLAALFVTTGLRMLVAGAGLWSWTAGHSLGNLEDETVLWLPLRWGLGFVGPLLLGWMAWQSAKIRSTQSATGILYVVVIFCFLGELTSQLLQPTGFTL
jgi:hypothetical protein